MFKPSSDFFAGRFKAVLLVWISFVVCASWLSCLFHVALWSRAVKGSCV